MAQAKAASPSPNDPMASQYALRVALQTMKERCIALQRRLTTIEDENQQLREHMDERGAAARANSSSTATTKSAAMNGDDSAAAAENLQLRLQVDELQRQKTQLNEHIGMVSTENRKLWSRLSQMAKQQGKPNISTKEDSTATPESQLEAESVASPRSGGANQNLIRSKTFTQHSPNPNLRYKLISNDDEELKDISLEEVALDAFGDKVETGAGEDFAEAAPAELGFAYLNVDETSSSTDANDMDFNLEAKKCIDGLLDMRREVKQQQQELHAALRILETRIALQPPCAECAQKSQKPEMADKSLETDESLNELKPLSTNKQQLTLENPMVLNGHNLPEAVYQPQANNSHLNIIQEKIQADAMLKTCPMCGKTYYNDVSFDAFREHVEMHFVDEGSELEASLDRNFEFISHTVGDF